VLNLVIRKVPGRL